MVEISSRGAWRLGATVPALLLWSLATVAAAPAQAPGEAHRQARHQTESDDYTRYELLAPDTASFHILYEVTATAPGATAYFNPIRKGSDASGEAIFDRASGLPLRFEEVTGEQARQTGMPDADTDMHYLCIHLPHPVPATGGVRLLIDKTYKDPKSYYRDGEDRIVFARALGVRRNTVVLPAGYEVIGCNVPSQVLSEPDGRIKISFMHSGPDAAPLVVTARKLGAATSTAAASTSTASGSTMTAPAPALASAPATAPAAEPAPAPSKAPAVAPAPAAAPAAPHPAAAPARPAAPAMPAAPDMDERLSERAHQDRTIVYFLRQPDTHAFDLYHDYTETHEGTDKYLNVVRPGSASSGPAALILDTGETLRVETLRGEALRHAGLTAAELHEIAGPDGKIAPETEVVIAHFQPLAKGQTVRLRISETYTDPRSYRVDNGTLVFDRTFGRPRNAVVLPAGWYLTASTIPAVVSETPDGRVRLDFMNPRPDEIAVLIHAKHRPAPSTTTSSSTSTGSVTDTSSASH